MKALEIYKKNKLFDILREGCKISNKDKLPPLFHGTDESIMGIPEVYRMEIKKAYETIIESITPFYTDDVVTMAESVLSDSDYRKLLPSLSSAKLKTR
ncbi:MAG: hypothetical protein IJ899_20955 [Blautia sp.]|nr:hypothetical protein [Blautia sp.]